MSRSRAAGSGASISRLLEVQALQRWGRLTEDACRQHRSWEAQGRRETHSTCLSCHLCRGFCEPGPLSLCSGQCTRESPLHASIRTESLQSCLPLGDLCTVAHQVPLSMGFSRHPEFTHTHVHRVSDAIQPPHPLSSPSPPAPNPSQHQSLFQ